MKRDHGKTFFYVLSLVTGLVCVQPVHAAERILLLGDSHTVQSFGRHLDGLIRTQFPAAKEVTTRGVCGSSPAWWFREQVTTCGYFFRNKNQTIQQGLEIATPLLTTLLEEHNPTLTIVALGANIVRAPDDEILTTSRQMAEQVAASGSRCVWVGPPHGRNKPEPKFSQFYQVLEQAVKPHCELIDSRPFLGYPAEGGDGAHYDSLGEPGRAMARAWAEKIFERLR